MGYIYFNIVNLSRYQTYYKYVTEAVLLHKRHGIFAIGYSIGSKLATFNLHLRNSGNWSSRAIAQPEARAVDRWNSLFYIKSSKWGNFANN